MTYYEITQKLKDLTMTPEDWKWLDDYLHNDESIHHEHIDVDCRYKEIVNAYQAREEGKHPVCDTMFGTCRYCGKDFICGYKGFCNKQTHTLE